MPNWVKIYCTVKGGNAEITRFKRLMINFREVDAVPFFDFEAIAPEPEWMKLKITASIAAAIEVLTGHPLEMEDRLQSLDMGDLQTGALDLPHTCLAWPWAQEQGITTLSEMRRYLEEKRPTAMEAARRWLASREAAANAPWTPEENWGTNKVAFDFRNGRTTDQHYEFEFDTAWSFPEPIFRKLNAEFPTLIFTCEYLADSGDYGGYCRAAGSSFELRRKTYSLEENPVYKAIAIQKSLQVNVSDDDIF
jgi:hypothetical protein